MPIYEYRCETCSHKIEVWAKVSDPPPECPRCGAVAMSKLVSLSSFRLKGGGWYAQGYGGSKGRNGGNGGDESSDSKPAEKKPAEKKPAEKKPTESAKPEPSTATATPPSTG